MPANETVTLSFPDGARIEAPARWRGRALAGMRAAIDAELARD